MTPTLRERILEETTNLTTESGWSELTMAKLAERVGVSRQTVYNEVGTKAQLAETVVLNEMLRFLALVEAAFAAHPDDVVEAIRMATFTVLELGENDPMLSAAMSVRQGAASALLPARATNAASMMAASVDSMLRMLAPYPIALGETELYTSVDCLVRLLISKLLQPTQPPAEAADRMAWLTAQLLPTYDRPAVRTVVAEPPDEAVG